MTALVRRILTLCAFALTAGSLVACGTSPTEPATQRAGEPGAAAPALLAPDTQPSDTTGRGGYTLPHG